MPTILRIGVGVVLAALLIASPCGPASGQGGGPNESKIVSLGDSLTAGFQDGALYAAGQQTGYVVHVARSMNTEIALPLMAAPGIPTPDARTGQGLMVQQPDTCALSGFVLATGRTTGRVDPTVPAMNIAVPGHTMSEAVAARWAIDPANPEGTADTAEDFVLGFPYALLRPGSAPRSQLETAVDLVPTFIIVWLGNNDVLSAALGATVNKTTLTPINAFDENADALFSSLVGTGAEGAILNIPDVTVFPNLFSGPELETITGLDAKKMKRLLGVKKSDFVPLSAFPTIQSIVAGDASGPLAPNQILTKKELNKIRKSIKKFNEKLAVKAQDNGWALVDMNSILAGFEGSGVDVPGLGRLTTGYFGGIFSVDGVHPTRTGHALIASAVLAVVNERYMTSFPLPDVAAVAATDPEVCLGSGGQALTLADLARVAPAARAAESVIVHGRAGL